MKNKDVKKLDLPIKEFIEFYLASEDSKRADEIHQEMIRLKTHSDTVTDWMSKAIEQLPLSVAEALYIAFTLGYTVATEDQTTIATEDQTTIIED